MADTLAAELRDGLVTFLSPLTAAATPDGAAALLRSIGHVGAVAEDAGLRAELQRIAGLAGGLATLDADELQSWAGLQRLLALARGLLDAVRGAQALLADPTLAAQAGDLGADLAERLAAIYLRDTHPLLFREAALLGLVTPAELADPQPLVADDDGTVRRLPWPRDALHLDRVRALVEDPAGYLAGLYLPGGMARASDAHAGAAALFPHVADLARTLKLRVVSGLERGAPEPPAAPPGEEEVLPDWPPPEDLEPAPDPGPLDPAAFQRSYRPRLVFELPPLSADPRLPARFGVALAASSAEHPDGVRGYVLGLFGGVGWSEERGGWRIGLASAGTIPAVSLGPGGVRLGPGQVPGAETTATLSVERIAAPGAPAFVVGGADASRLEIGALKLGGGLALSATRQAAHAAVEARSGALVLAPGGGDGFLGSLVPRGGVRVAFDLGLVLSSDRGLEFSGGSALELPLAPNLTVGPVTVRGLRLTIDTPDGAIRLRAAGALALRLGPITLLVEGLGLQLAATFPERGGNLGPVQLDVGPAPPTGAGILIDAGPVSGSGYLFHDPEAGLYAGAVHLDVNGIALQAVGLLSTRMPGGAPGFSLLVVLTVTGFAPIQLGFGFRLVAVGGLLGYNRTADVEALRAGLRTGALDALLFPPDPLADAPRLVRTLGAVMPPRAGQFLAGPVGRIVWGVPTILTIELGVVLELPSPTRLLVLGQLRAVLPSPDRALVRLQMDALGVVDFDRGTLAVDAVLHDSSILTYALTGDMALRAHWGGDPTFLLAVGGFHPRFSPPAGFPKLERLALTITKGDSVRLRLESYLALTSNTAQVGARVDLLVRAGSFSVEGYLGFDALFQFSPFRFVVDIQAGVTLKWHGHTLLGVTLELTLSGPSPWNARGKATFKIWRFSKSVSFDRTIGAEEPPPALPPADPLPELLQALRDVRSWSAPLPPEESLLLTLREGAATGGPLVHPLGELSVRQRVVPLGVTIERFGSTTPAGERRFTLQVASMGGGRPPEATPVLDFFAPAQFLELSDTERLRRPSFERLEAGIQLAGGLTFGGVDDPTLLADVPLDYETVIPGVAEDVRTVAPLDEGADALRARQALQPPTAPLRTTGAAKYRARPLGTALPEPRYVVASTANLAPVALPGLAAEAPSYTAAAEALWRHEERNPALRGTLQVVTTFSTDGARP